MSQKIPTTAIGFLSMIILMSLTIGGSAGQNPQWKGKIETVDGVKVVRNPNEPLFGDIKLDLEEDLKIGNPDDENYLFYRVRGIDIDNEGNIYVADMSNFRVQKFDKNGKYLLTFGRQGQGPGEFNQPTTVHIEEKSGNVYVLDQNHTIEIFARDGKAIRSIRSEKTISNFNVTQEGKIIALIFTGSNMSLIHRLSEIGPDGKPTQLYIEVPYKPSALQKDGRTFPVSTGYEWDIQFDLMDRHSLFYGDSKEYVLTLIDLTGKSVSRISKDKPAPKFTAKEKARFKNIPLPDSKPYFYAIYTDDLCRIYVQTNKTRAEEDVTHKEVDVFSRDGYFLFRTTLPKYTYVIRNGYVYALEVKEDEIVKRYKIKNWGTLKSGL